MDKIIWVLDTVLYLLIILTISCKIFQYRITRKYFIIIDVLAIIGLFYSAFVIDKNAFALLCGVVHILQIILIYASIAKIKLLLIIPIYAFVYSVNSIIIVSVNSFSRISITNITVVELTVHILVAICLSFCCFNSNLQYKIQRIIYIVPKRVKLLTLFALCTSALLMVLILSNPEMYINSSWSISVRIALIFFSLFICTTFPILIITVLTNSYLKKQNESFERELQAQADHYVALAESNKELRRFKHDFKNLRIGITKALTSGDCEIALEMIENGQNDFIQATDNIVRYNTGNGIVDAILSEKQKKATASNTAIEFQGIIPQTVFSPTDLCIIFGNTLDNAIEACEKISIDTEKAINVSVNCSGGFVFISITNPVAEKVIVHNNHIETTKKDRSAHGFGLYSLQKIAKKYDGEMNIISEEHTFTLTLELCL